MKALLLAAGKGSRISGISRGLPKPLMELAGKPVLIHNLELLAKHRIKEVWINLHTRPEVIRQLVGTGKKWGLKVRYSLEPGLLGTSGALKKLQKHFSDGPFWVIYGDNYTDCDLKELMKYHRKSRNQATLALFDRSRNRNSGIAGGTVRLSQGRILSFQEGKTASKWVNAGIYALEPTILQEIKNGYSDFGKDVFPYLLKKNMKISGYPMKGFCLALDTPKAFKTAQKIAMERT